MHIVHRVRRRCFDGHCGLAIGAIRVDIGVAVTIVVTLIRAEWYAHRHDQDHVVAVFEGLPLAVWPVVKMHHATQVHPVVETVALQKLASSHWLWACCAGATVVIVNVVEITAVVLHRSFLISTPCSTPCIKVLFPLSMQYLIGLNIEQVYLYPLPLVKLR
jgi:hypothetical protein